VLSSPLADHAQLADAAADGLEHFTLGVLDKFDGSEPHSANEHVPTALRV